MVVSGKSKATEDEDNKIVSIISDTVGGQKLVVTFRGELSLASGRAFINQKDGGSIDVSIFAALMERSWCVELD